MWNFPLLPLLFFSLRISADRLALVERACDAAIALDDHKRRLYEFVASRMGVLAPNLTAIVGSNVAARLMALAGGLVPLSNIPASNLLVLGQKRRSAADFSRLQPGSAQVGKHMNILSVLAIIIIVVFLMTINQYFLMVLVHPTFLS